MSAHSLPSLSLLEPSPALWKGRNSHLILRILLLFSVQKEINPPSLAAQLCQCQPHSPGQPCPRQCPYHKMPRQGLDMVCNVHLWIQGH